MIVAGLTGSIAMGKSETARMFAARGIPVFDSDAAVHELYDRGGKAVDAISALAPSAIVEGAVDRRLLAAAIQQDKQLLARVEGAVHPLVRAKQKDFLYGAESKGAKLVILDVPLLFETGQNRDVDKIIVVSAPPQVQELRALNRPGMTREKLAFILSRQVPDAVKRAGADYVIDTSISLEDAGRQVERIISELEKLEISQ